MSAVATHEPAHSGAVIKSAAARLIPAAVILWALLLAVGYLLTHGLENSVLVRWDHSVERSLSRHRSGGLTTATHYATFGAETLTVIGIGLVVFIVLRLFLRRWRESIFLAVALIGEVTIFVSTTMFVNRDRPDVAQLDGAPPTSSFPSGHTAASVALYGSLAVIAVAVGARAWVRWILLVLAVVMPVTVAMSRLYRGMHFPTDVIAGALFALVWLMVARAVLLRRRS
jgi:membrane-associated phospholipid phosphatase